MTMHSEIDPELVGGLEGFLQAVGGGLDLTDIPGTRRIVSGMIAAVKAEAPKIEGVEIENLAVPGFGGGPDVPVRVYRPSGQDDTLAALLWMHGGGWVLGDLELDDLMATQLAKDVGCAVVAVDYRLAPEHPFPAALHDCYAALKWMFAESGTLGIDRERIAIGGASAGGNLAAALALMARDQGELKPAFQLLVYPALDDRTAQPVSRERPETPFWTRQNCIHAWTAYLGREPGGADVPSHAAPGREADLSGLPPAYIPVGTLDPFLDEDIDYARRLMAAGVPVELHVYPRAFHAFDVFGQPGRLARQFVADRDTVLRRVLSRPSAG